MFGLQDIFGIGDNRFVVRFARAAADTSPFSSNRIQHVYSNEPTHVHWTNKMKIDTVLFAPGMGAFYYDDQAAIRSGRKQDGFIYVGKPVTNGFASIRMPAGCLSIGLVLSDGSTAWGDMMNVQYSGAGGRDPFFDAGTIQRLCKEIVVPRLLDLPLSSFRGACDKVLAPRENGERLPLSVEYGVSQALLALFSMLGNRTMAETISSEFDCKIVLNPVPIYAQSGDDRYNNVDKMILKNVDILPHGLINATSKFGRDGEIFLDYVEWVANRIQLIGGSEYRPKLHFDLYGMIGLTFGLDPSAIASFIVQAASRAGPFSLHIESPADFGSRQGQIDGFCAILEQLSDRGCGVKIVADEWCNTLSDIKAFADAHAADIMQIKMPDVGSVADSAAAVLYCKDKGAGAYLGGSCTETDCSARTSVHIAISTGADMLLAKPGMGVDEGVSIVGNEQSRLLSSLRYKAGKRHEQLCA